VYSYSTYKNTRTTTNAYLSNGKTYQPLYTYYRPNNYYNAAGYYSTTFLLIYYNGYGYNFYYNTYGYYEYSVNPSPPSSGGGGSTGAVIGILCCCLCFAGGLYAFKKMTQTSAESAVEMLADHVDPNGPTNSQPTVYDGNKEGTTTTTTMMMQP